MKFSARINNIFAILLLTAAYVNVANAGRPGSHVDSMIVGGSSDVLFVNETLGFASATGTFAALAATITYFDPQGDGSIILETTHNFKTADNGYFNTVDKTLLLPVMDNPGVYYLSTKFTINESGGGLEGYVGQSFTGAGILNFNNNTANVRYEGKLKRKSIWFKVEDRSVFKYFRN